MSELIARMIVVLTRSACCRIVASHTGNITFTLNHEQCLLWTSTKTVCTEHICNLLITYRSLHTHTHIRCVWLQEFKSRPTGMCTFYWYVATCADGILRMKHSRVGGGVGLLHIRLGVSDGFRPPTDAVGI